MDEKFKDKQLTEFSNREINYLRNEYISAKEAYARLNGGIPARTFEEIVSYFYKGIIKNGLIDGLCEIDAELSRGSISHKVNGWLSGKYRPTERIDLIKICFALKMGEIEANTFLSLMTEGGFHMRNPEELAYAYCLRVGKSFCDAVSLISSLKPLVNEPAPEDALTEIVVDAFADVQTDEDFHRFYAEQYDNLGRLHNTAYERFDTLLKLLTAPPMAEEDMEPEREYSLDYVVEIYLRMNIPQDERKKRGKNASNKNNTAKKDLLQKMIYKRWPNAQSVLKVKNRHEDVSRKLLLLLYMVTEGEDGKLGNDKDKFNENADKASRFDNHYWRVNSLLYECGMSRIDPRSVFDWLILYGINKKDDNEIMSERMQEVLDIVFGTETNAETRCNI